MEIRKLLRAGLRWWWLLLALPLVAALMSYLVSSRQPWVFEAKATILVGQTIQSTEVDRQDVQASEQLTLTYANMARRQPVLQPVVEELGLDVSWQKLKSQVSARPVGATQLIEITVEAGSPLEAELIADKVAEHLILLSPTALQNEGNNGHEAFVSQRLDELKNKIEAGQARLDDLEAAVVGSESAENTQALRDEITLLENMITDWERNYAQLRSLTGGASPNYLTILETAQASLTPVRPQIFLNTVLAGIVGLLLALGAVFLLEQLDDTIKNTDDISERLELIPLGTVPLVKQHRPGIGTLFTAARPLSPNSEALRIIRNNIQFVNVDNPSQTIIITSAIDGEGKSTIAANLGVVMAQAGHKTIIVDADLRRPTQSQIFDTSRTDGLTELLCRPDLAIENYLNQTPIKDLSLLTSGELPPNPAELLASQRMNHLIAELKEVADVIIFDSPPSAIVADAAALSKHVDGVLFVIKMGRARWNVVKQALFNIQQVDGQLLGAILNGVSKQEGYTYHSYYTSEPSLLEERPKPGKVQRKLTELTARRSN